jgi:hypothetical protein
MKPQISSRDLKSLSLFLDGQLSPAERQRLEKRLQGNQALSQALNEMQQTRTILRSMPKRRAPHNFTLSPQMIEVRGKKPVFPVLGFISALASILFVLVLAGDLTGIFTSSTKSVALQSMPVMEAAAPTLESAQEKRAQSEINDSPPPAETQAEEVQAMKAIAPASDETGAESSNALPPALLEAGQETNVTAVPTLEGMYAKEAPAPEVNAPGEPSTPEGTPTRDGFENELKAMVSPTEEEVTLQAQAKQAGTDLIPPALSQNATPATEMVGAVDLSEPSSEGAGVSQGEAGEPGQNTGLRAEESSFEAQTSQFILRIFEVIFAITALITAAVFFSQRRKTIQ